MSVLTSELGPKRLAQSRSRPAASRPTDESTQSSQRGCFRPKSPIDRAAPSHPSGPSIRRCHQSALSSSCPFLADAGSSPGNCPGMEETIGAPGSFAVSQPRRLRASGRDGGRVVNRPPSPFSMLLSRHTRRRELIAALGGVAVLVPLVARAQGAVPVIGFLNQGSAKASAYLVAEFRKGLNKVGYVEGQNVLVEYRWAESQYNQLPELAADLVRRNVAVLAASFASCRSCGKSRDIDNSYLLHHWQRPGQARLGCKPQPAGRQRYGRCFL